MVGLVIRNLAGQFGASRDRPALADDGNTATGADSSPTVSTTRDIGVAPGCGRNALDNRTFSATA
jgi:hypothetical protein